MSCGLNIKLNFNTEETQFLKPSSFSNLKITQTKSYSLSSVKHCNFTHDFFRTIGFFKPIFLFPSLSTSCKIYKKKKSLQLCSGLLVKISFYFQYAR